MEIINDVHLLDGIRGANCYFVTAGENGYLIDAGMPGNASGIIRQIQEMGWKPERIGFILITHPDIDHVGSLAELKRLTKVAIAIHTDDASALAGERESKKTKGILGFIFRLMIKTVKREPVRADRLLNDGDEIGPFMVIHTPGHTMGSICLYYPEKGALFVGDALRTNKNGNPCISPKIMNHDHSEAMDSLKKIKRLDLKFVFPGHGRPITEDVSLKLSAM